MFLFDKFNVCFEYYNYMKRLGLKFLLLFALCIVALQPAFAIKIGLDDGIKQTYIGSSKKSAVYDGKTGKELYRLNPFIPYTLRAYNNAVVIKIDGKYFSFGTNYVIIKPLEEKCFLATKKRWYRGEMIVYNIDKKLVVINSLPIEEYLLGVVPSEMPSKWNNEAHKAQAIAARSYAIANLGKRKHSGYDLKDTPLDQAYGGASAETPQTTKAVMSTRGIVLTYNGKVIPAYYHASSGGQTVSSGAVWAKDLPYIKSVPAYDDGIRKNGHGVGMSQHGANNLANKGYNAYQILNYFYKNVKFSVVKTQL